MCESSGKIHECGWSKCIVKSSHGHMTECGYTGQILLQNDSVIPPDSNIQTSSSSSQQNSNSNASINDMLTFRRSTPENEMAIMKTLNESKDWIQKNTKPSVIVNKPKSIIDPPLQENEFDSMMSMIQLNTLEPETLLFPTSHFSSHSYFHFWNKKLVVRTI